MNRKILSSIVLASLLSLSISAQTKWLGKDHGPLIPTMINQMVDPFFGTGGIVATPVGAGNAVAQAVIALPDGKVVAAGFAFNGNNNDFAVIRFHSNGAVDPSFDAAGAAKGAIMTPVGVSDDEAFAIAALPDGKFILAGQTYDGIRTSIAVVRFHDNGSVDTSFGDNGRVVVTPTSGNAIARSVAVASNGKIVVAGNGMNGTNFDIVTLRLMADGGLDPTFDGDGVAITPIGTGNDYGYGVAVQPDGKVVAAGYFTDPMGLPDSVVIRYRADGVLDETFGEQGISRRAFSPDVDEALSLALAPDGKIVVAGCYRNEGQNDFLVARFLENGLPDPAFGEDGFTFVRFSTSHDLAMGVALQPDGKIVAAGFGNNGTNLDFAVARLQNDGSPDMSFGGDGSVMTMAGMSADIANGVAIAPDGGIIAVGRTVGNVANFGVVRYHPGTATVTGRVLRPNGVAIRDARVSLVDQNGSVRTATTSSFGIYEISNVETAATYTLTVSSKRYRFAPRSLNLSGNLTAIDMIGLE